MKGAWTVGQFAEIPLRLHWSFGLLFFWFAYVGYSEGMSNTGIALFLVFALMLFVCVVLHEFGHALTAKRFGIATRDIILLPMGGVARLNHMPEKPMQELAIALAGPAVNILLMFFFGLLIFIIPGQTFEISEEWHKVFDSLGNFLPLLFWMNLGLAVFNMIPAYPMDGGRVLRALLSFGGNRLRATQIASVVGQILASGFIAYGLWNRLPIHILIGLFVFFTARWEYQVLKKRDALSKRLIRDVLRTDFTVLMPHQTIREAHNLKISTDQRHFLIGDLTGQIIGVLHGLFLEDAVKNNAFDKTVGAYMSPRFEFVSPQLSFSAIIDLMTEKGYSILPVLEDGRLIGVVDQIDIKKNM